MTGEHQKLHKAIVVMLAADLIDGLVKLLGDEGIDIGPNEISMEGVPMGTMTTAQVSEQLRQISKEIKPLSATTTSQDNTL